MHELLAGKSPKRTVLVAIIDNGIDTAHVDLRANLWTNPKEIGGEQEGRRQQRLRRRHARLELHRRRER